MRLRTERLLLIQSCPCSSMASYRMDAGEQQAIDVEQRFHTPRPLLVEELHDNARRVPGKGTDQTQLPSVTKRLPVRASGTWPPVKSPKEGSTVIPSPL